MNGAMALKRIRKLKRVITGGSIGGLSIATQLVPTDAAHCQELVDVIDNRRVFTAPVTLEIGDDVIKSVKEVRSLAVSTQSLVDTLEASEEARCIAQACQTLMRDYRPGMDDRVLDAALQALRAEVGGSVSVLVRIFNLRGPVEFDVSDYADRATQVLEGWLDRT